MVITKKNSALMALIPFFSILLFIHPSAAEDAITSSDFTSGTVLVKFVTGTSDDEKEQIRIYLNADLIRTYKSIGVEYWKLSDDLTVEEAVDLLTQMPAVKYAEPNYLYTPQALPDDPEFDQLWHLQNSGQAARGIPHTAGADISASEAWDVETGSPDMVIAVIDSGVAFEHPDLTDNMWNNSGEIPDNGLDDDGNGYADDYYGWDFVNRDSNPSDYSRDLDGDGHGSHVAGIIAARGNNGLGVTGVMWQARIMALQVFDLFDTNSFQSARIQNNNIIEAVTYAVENGAKIINCSFGGSSFSQSLYDAYENAGRNGVLVVAAAGNETNNNDRFPVYPASFNLANMMSVAATDETDQLAEYSNYGASSVHVAAPGGGYYASIYSTIPPAREVLFSEDFENGDDRWEKEWVAEPWSRTFNSQFGSYVMQDSEGNYQNNENSYIQLKTPIDAGGFRGLHIQLKARYQLEYNSDFLFVEGSDDGMDFSVDFPVSGEITGNSFGILTLLSWGSDEEIGSNFFLRFRLQSDDTVTGDGVYIDNIVLTGIRWSFTGNEYGYKSGTSMASPVAAGAAGLVWSHRPELTAEQVKQVLINSADPISGLAGTNVSGGRINVFNALDVSPEDLSSSSDDPSSASGTSDGGGGGCFILSLTG